MHIGCTCFGSTYTKIGTIQRRLAWPLRKDDTQIREAFHIFRPKKRSFCNPAKLPIHGPAITSILTRPLEVEDDSEYNLLKSNVFSFDVSERPVER